MPDSERQENKDKKLIKDNETKEEQEELNTILDQISEQPAEKAESPSRSSADEQVIKGPRGSKDNVENVEELLEKITETPGSQEKATQKSSLLQRLRRFFGL